MEDAEYYRDIDFFCLATFFNFLTAKDTEKIFVLGKECDIANPHQKELGAALRRAIDDSYKAATTGRGVPREVIITGIVSDIIKTPIAFDEAENILHCAGFRVDLYEIGRIPPFFSATISEYRIFPFGRAGAYIGLKTAESGKKSKIVSVDGSIVTSTL